MLLPSTQPGEGGRPFLANVLYGGILTDMETGFKVIRTDVLRSLGIRSFTFDFEVEVTAKLFRGKFRVYEIPITYTGRTYEEGKKITWKDGVRALVALLRFRWQRAESAPMKQAGADGPPPRPFAAARPQPLWLSETHGTTTARQPGER